MADCVIHYAETQIGPAAGGTSVTVRGADFASGLSATIGGSDASATFVSDTEITLTSPAHAVGAVDIVVTNPSANPVTLTNAFQYAPTLSSTNHSVDFEDTETPYGGWGSVGSTNEEQTTKTLAPGSTRAFHGGPLAGLMYVAKAMGANSGMFNRAGGVWISFYETFDDNSMDVSNGGQIKGSICRNGDDNRWLMFYHGGTQGEYQRMIAAHIDRNAQSIEPAVAPMHYYNERGMRYIVHYERDTVAYTGTAEVWIDGKFFGSWTNADLGGTATDNYDGGDVAADGSCTLDIGATVQQGLSGDGLIQTWIDDIVVGNGIT